MNLLREFLKDAPPGTSSSLAALACAESLTDSVAVAIYKWAPLPGLSAEEFVSAFKYSGLTEPRNSEWNLVPELRQDLITLNVLDQGIKESVHHFLLTLGQNKAKQAKAGSEVPSYLFTVAGKAYHAAGAGDLDTALRYYSDTSRGRLTGTQWLGAKLAEEQERVGVLPKGSVETTFLRALVLWREGREREAMPLFRQVAASDLVRREVAISLHILGNDNRRGQRRPAEGELLRSIEINRELGDDYGVAQALHSLANLLARQERWDEAEQAYRQSIELGEAIGHRFHVAQTLHSLANLLSRRERWEEAEKAYRQSIEIGEELENSFHVAQTLHSLANLFARRGSVEEAEASYRQSMDMRSEIGDRFGLAQTLHSLGDLLVRAGRTDEADAVYRESIKIGEEIRNRFHVAQTLHGFANLLVQQNRYREAEEAFRKSVSIGEELRNDRHVAQVLRSHGLAIAAREPDRALSLLGRAIEMDRRGGRERFVRLIEREMKQIRDRSTR